MRFKSFLFFLVCFFSCKQKPEAFKIFKTPNFILVDTVSVANKFLGLDNYNTDYPIYYIGKQLDTIRIGKRYWRGRTKGTGVFKFPVSREYSERTLRIFVDTSIKSNSPVEYFSSDERLVEDSTINYASFLFTIKNISDSAIYLGHTFSVYYINREVKGLNGDWVEVDKKIFEMGLCETGEPLIVLKPDEVVVSKIRRYEGSFIADFRLAFGYGNNVVYSNVFRDSIDKKIFEKAIALSQHK